MNNKLFRIKLSPALLISALVACVSFPATAQEQTIQGDLFKEVPLGKVLYIGSSFNPEKIRRCEKFADKDNWKLIIGNSNAGPNSPCYKPQAESIHKSGSIIKSGIIYGLEELKFSEVTVYSLKGKIIEIHNSNYGLYFHKKSSPTLENMFRLSTKNYVPLKVRLEQSLGPAKTLGKEGDDIYSWHDKKKEISYKLSYSLQSGMYYAIAEKVDK